MPLIPHTTSKTFNVSPGQAGQSVRVHDTGVYRQHLQPICKVPWTAAVPASRLTSRLETKIKGLVIQNHQCMHCSDADADGVDDHVDDDMDNDGVNDTNDDNRSSNSNLSNQTLTETVLEMRAMVMTMVMASPMVLTTVHSCER